GQWVPARPRRSPSSSVASAPSLNFHLWVEYTMNRAGFDRTARPARLFAWAPAGAALAVSFAAAAASGIRVRHAPPAHDSGVFKGLVNKFNRSQSDVRVQLKAFASVAEIERAISPATKRDDKPHLAQLEENRAPGGAGRSYVQPLNALLATHPIKNAQ